MIKKSLSSPSERKIHSLPLNGFKFKGGFWGPRIKGLRETILPHQFQKLVDTGRLENFARAAGKSEHAFSGLYFNDSDVYKWLEAASYTTVIDPDNELSEMITKVISAITLAQEEDGYLNTYFYGSRKNDRWQNIRDMHELYCAGHLFEAAVAHQLIDKVSPVMQVAEKFANLIHNEFNLQNRLAPPGHPEIELALVRLAEATNDLKFLELAQFFIDQRGSGLIGGREYHQDHVPFREMDQLTGHAVRALYLSCGAASIAQHTGEINLERSLTRLWENMTKYQIYVNGGLGSRHEGEAFGNRYELPNERAYTETCAAIANVMWNHRMLQLTGQLKYADLMEWSLYNAVLPGISLDLTKYFYVNPLSNDGSHRRQEWFHCACCPPNLARTLASLSTYFFGTSSYANSDVDCHTIWFHSYAQGRLTFQIDPSQRFLINLDTGYPYDETIDFEISESISQQKISLMLRVPGWCETPAVEINGKQADVPIALGKYVNLIRVWNPGDTIRLHLPMRVRKLECHPFVFENSGRIALARGPLLYCIEQETQPGFDIRQLSLNHTSTVNIKKGSGLFENIDLLSFEAQSERIPEQWNQTLYQNYEKKEAVHEPLPITAVPFYAWGNRSPMRMQVWLKHF